MAHDDDKNLPSKKDPKGNKEGLPDSIQDLFKNGLKDLENLDLKDLDFSNLDLENFDLDNLDLDKLGFDPEKMGLPEGYQEKLKEALPKMLGQQQESIEKAKEFFLIEDKTGTASQIFEKMERLADIAQGKSPQEKSQENESHFMMQRGNHHAQWQNKSSGQTPVKKNTSSKMTPAKAGKNLDFKAIQDRLMNELENEELCSDEDFGVLLSLAVDIVDSGRVEDGMAMYSLLQIIRPDQPQPYVNNFTLVWKQQSVEAAADAYAMMMPIVQSPTYRFYAADCFEHADRIEEAQKAMEEAIALLENEEYGFQLDTDLERNIREYHRELMHRS